MSLTSASLIMDAENEAKAWYAIWTRSRQEKTVKDELQRKGLEPFLPAVKAMRQWKDRKQSVEFPLFPSYCFVRIDPEDKLRVLELRGVVQLVGTREHPVPIPDAEIDALRRLMASGVPYASYHTLEEGMPVEVVRGPLQGLRGSLIRMTNKYRLLIGIRLIQQSAVVEIDAANVIPLTGSSMIGPYSLPSKNRAGDAAACGVL